MLRISVNRFWIKKLLKLIGIKPYHKVKDGGVFASDVDDTLIMWSIPSGYTGPLVETNYNGFKDVGIPNLHAVNHLKKMKARGYSVVVWSAGGSEWAEAAVKALGIEEYVDTISPKFDFHLDDVDCPTDKIGKWSYISMDGKSWKKDIHGNIVQRDILNKFQTYEGEQK
jgi:hypothetical protein